ncbi:hypothetical protein TI01_1062 [Lysobacter sp. A03]|nr:hypothetical protein TI01_1062 [Lysobacter sp. A03]
MMMSATNLTTEKLFDRISELLDYHDLQLSRVFLDNPRLP